MNALHLHLIALHFPIVLLPFGFPLYLIGVAKNSQPLTATALSCFLIASLFAGVAYLSGEGAEEIAEHVAGIAEHAIETHEDGASIALWFSVALGLLSACNLATLFLKPAAARRFVAPVIVLSLVTAAALGYAAQLGGRIRHPEAFNAPQAQPSAREQNHADDD